MLIDAIIKSRSAILTATVLLFPCIFSISLANVKVNATLGIDLISDYFLVRRGGKSALEPRALIGFFVRRIGNIFFVSKS